MRTTRNRKLLGIILGVSLLALSSCNTTPQDMPRSKAFYINDQAGALLTSTQYFIYSLSSQLYDDHSQTAEFKAAQINGTQVVVATHLGPVDSIDTTAIFNKWEIGANDMGMLLMLYFSPDPNDKYSFNYLGMTREIGPRLAGYVSMFRLEDIFVNTWEHPMFETVHRSDYDYKLTYFYLSVMEEIYTRVYSINAFNAEALMDDYDELQYESFYNSIPKGNVTEFSIKWWGWLLISLGVLFLLGTGRFWFVFLLPGSGGARGGGGRSGGYKYTR